MKRIVAGILIMALVAVIIWQQRRVDRLKADGNAFRRQQTAKSEEIQQLTFEHNKAVKQLAELRENNERLGRSTTELLKLRGEVAQLRSTVALQGTDPAYMETKELLNRIDMIRQRLSKTPTAMIPEMRFLKDDDYWDAGRSSMLTEEDYLIALSSLRRAGERTFISTLLRPALQRYTQANNGQFPSDVNQLRPYFASPVEDAILKRWVILPAETVGAVDMGKTVITTKAPIDEDWDVRYALGIDGYISLGKSGNFNGWGVTNPNILLAPALQAASESYKAANGGREPDDLSQSAPYLNLTTPEQRSAFEKLVRWSKKK
jgi:hypothetical protein